MADRPKIKNWATLAGTITTGTIFLGVIGILETGVIIGIGFLLALFLINKFAPWKYYSWDETTNQNDIELKKGVTLAHNVVTFVLLFTIFLWVLEEWGCSRVPDWFHQHCVAILKDPNFHTLQETAHKVENKEVKNNVATKLPDNESYSGFVQGDYIMLISSKEMVKQAIYPYCRIFLGFPLLMMFLTLVAFICLFVAELVANPRFTNREAATNE